MTITFAPHVMTYDNQFDREPIDQLPDPNKKYFITHGRQATGFTYLFKLLWIIDKYDGLIDKICEYKKDINVKVGDYTALHFVCSNYTSDNIVKVMLLLIKLGADVNATTRMLLTPLHCVPFLMVDRQMEIVQLLINAGADINAIDICDWSVLRTFREVSSIYTPRRAIATLIKEGVDLKNENSVAQCYNDYKFCDAIVTYRKHKPREIEPFLGHFNKDQKELLGWFKKYKASIEPILDVYNDIHYRPNNIGALLCESNFAISAHKPYYSNKYEFLFKH